MKGFAVVYRYLLITILFFLKVFNGIGQVVDYKTIHNDAIVIDTHNDVVQRILAGEDISIRTSYGHSDLPRFREGGIDVQVFSIWIPPDKTHRSYYDQANEQIDSIDSFVKRNSTQVGLGRSVEDIDRLIKQRKFVAMLGLEGGHPIADDLEKLEHFYNRGVRYMTVTWNNSTSWATSAKDETDPQAKLGHKGLNDFGKRVIGKMNELGMMVDVSHVGEKTFWDIIKITSKPVIASHSSVWTLCNHRRNLKDDQLKAIAAGGGVVFITFVPSFIDSTFSAKEKLVREKNKARIDSFSSTLKDDDFIKDQRVGEFLRNEYRPIQPPLKILIDHIDYVAKLIGVDHVGIGSDFDGITATPAEMDDVTHYPNITRELLKRGYSENKVRKILGENFLRVFREVQKK
ncbi:MAG TPA: dipeptidase [Bacteroidota bacterium]|nr:dipeptidase [Bacteroidota bacterium]